MYQYRTGRHVPKLLPFWTRNIGVGFSSGTVNQSDLTNRVFKFISSTRNHRRIHSLLYLNLLQMSTAVGTQIQRFVHRAMARKKRVLWQRFLSKTIFRVLTDSRGAATFENPTHCYAGISGLVGRHECALIVESRLKGVAQRHRMRHSEDSKRISMFPSSSVPTNRHVLFVVSCQTTDAWKRTLFRTADLSAWSWNAALDALE